METAFLNRWVIERRQCQCDRVRRIPDSQGLELKGTLVKKIGLCFGDRKGPFLTVSERAGRFKEAQTGKEKSVVEMVESESGNLILHCISQMSTVSRDELETLCWKSNNTNARLMASALSLALDPTFGIHSHKTLDTAQPCHLLKPK